MMSVLFFALLAVCLGLVAVICVLAGRGDPDQQSLDEWAAFQDEDLTRG